MNIGLMVEGDGEVEALAVLVRNILHRDAIYDVHVGKPMRVGGIDRILNGQLFPKQLEYACSDPQTLGILLTSDCDDGCVLESRAKLLARVTEICGEQPRVPVCVVLFNREFESLFLSQADILRDTTPYFRPDSAEQLVGTWETYRNAKGVVKAAIKEFSYKESRDQGKIAASLNIDQLGLRHRAGKRLLSAVESILYGPQR